MDNSEEYIEQCEKAKEIQKEWTPKENDTVFGGKQCRAILYDIPNEMKKRLLIWLPRQDQLQEMLWTVTATDIYHWLRKVTEFQMRNSCQSMEQLWLAFVMKEKYNKTWDGKEWNE